MSSSRTSSTSSGMFSPKHNELVACARLYLSPQRASRSSEFSVSRPDFWMASLIRCGWSMFIPGPRS